MLLTNGLYHRIGTGVMMTVPAYSTDPFEAITGTAEERHDLIGWGGLDRALTHLHNIHNAALMGREWIARAGTSTKEINIAIGVLDLTHPAKAAGLVPHRERLDISDIRQVCEQNPVGISPGELSNEALTAACHRNGWLLGTPEEYDAFRSVQYHVTTHLSSDGRHSLAAGDTAEVWSLAANVAPDLIPKNPADFNGIKQRWFLNEHSRYALGNFDPAPPVKPRPSLREAITCRFLDRLVRPALALAPLDGPQPATPTATDAPSTSVADLRRSFGIEETPTRPGHQPPPSTPGLEVDL
jgi:hypothetical protein